MAAIEVAPQRSRAYVDVRCPECGDVRTLNARSGRRVRAGTSEARCRICRAAARIEIEQEHRAWALAVWGAFTDAERQAIVLAFSARYRAKD